MNLTNHFLVAMPLLGNSVFSGSVVYITEHSIENGAIGVMINKPIGCSLKNAFRNINLQEYNPSWEKNHLYLGGPVHADNGFVLRESVTNSKTSRGKIFELTNDKSALADIASGAYRDDLFIAAGYASWSTFQLEYELQERDDWLVIKADARSLIFEVEPANRYQEALRLMGINNIGLLVSSGGSIA